MQHCRPIPIGESMSVAYSHYHDNVVDHLYAVVKDVAVRPNEEEVMETRWVGLEELRIELAERPDIYTPWFKAITRDLFFTDTSPWYHLSSLHKVTPLKETLVYHDPLQ
jgi:isopentenyldiphosphate isomerase